MNTSRRRLRAGLSITAAACAAVVLAVAVVGTWVERNVLDPDEAATRSVQVLEAEPVRRALADEITDLLVAAGASDVVSYRSVLEGVVEEVVATDGFRVVFRQAVADAQRALFERGQDALVLDLSGSVGVLSETIAATDPSLAARLPQDLPQLLVTVDDDVRDLRLWRWSHDVHRADDLALVLAVLLGAATVALEPDRRVGVVRVGAATVAAGLLVVALTAVAPARYTDRIADPSLRAAADGAAEVLLGDLRAFAIGVVLFGVLLAGAAAGGTVRARPLDASAVLAALRTRVAALPRTRGARLVTGAALGAGSLLLIWQRAVVPSLLVGVVGAYLGYLALLEIVGAVGPAGAPLRIDDPAAAPAAHRVRASVARATWVTAVVAVLGTVALVVVEGATSHAADRARAAGGMRCNGYAELCDRRLDQVAFAGAHNAMSAAADPGWVFAENLTGVPQQLEYGVRALLVKSHYGTETDVTLPGGTHLVATDFPREARARPGAEVEELSAPALAEAEKLVPQASAAGRLRDEVYLCHVYCELGAVPFVDTLGQIRRFLDRNPHEVIYLFVGDYVSNADTEEVFRRAGMLDRVWPYDPSQPLPTLRQMIDQRRQLFVLSEHGGPPPTWYVKGFGVFQDTPFTFASPADFTCVHNRGPTDAPLFLVNHFITNAEPPSVEVGRQVNAQAVLWPRVERCRQEREMLPNIVAVDFYDQGDLRLVVDRLNGVGG